MQMKVIRKEVTTVKETHKSYPKSNREELLLLLKSASKSASVSAHHFV